MFRSSDLSWVWCDKKWPCNKAVSSYSYNKPSFSLISDDLVRGVTRISHQVFSWGFHRKGDRRTAVASGCCWMYGGWAGCVTQCSLYSGCADKETGWPHSAVQRWVLLQMSRGACGWFRNEKFFFHLVVEMLSAAGCKKKKTLCSATNRKTWCMQDLFINILCLVGFPSIWGLSRGE